MSTKGIWFVYRSHHDGPLSKRVCRLDAPSVLAWFQDAIADARGAARPREVADAELGGPVHGLGTLLEAAKKHQLPAPKSTSALRKVLHEHLRPGGGPENIRLDDHSLRVLTGDGEAMFAYFFFDDEAMREHAERLAYLMHEDAELPEGDADGGYEPPLAVPALSTGGDGEGAAYMCLLTLPGKAFVLPGVRLPALAGHLRGAAPADAWPVELRRLRAALEEGDRTLGPALARCAAEGRDPGSAILRESEHVALLCAGYQQWVFFDDRWAAEHPDLAESLLRYAREWDPFPWSDPSKRSAAESAAAKQEGAWDEELAGRAAAEARRYRPSERFAGGELIDHAKFGLGVVRRAEATTIEVTFRDATRKLAHGATTG